MTGETAWPEASSEFPASAPPAPSGSLRGGYPASCLHTSPTEPSLQSQGSVFKGRSQGQRRLTYSISVPSTAQSPDFCALNSGKFYCSIMNCSSRQKLLEDAANGGQKHIRYHGASSLVPRHHDILRYKENDQTLTAPKAGSLRSRGRWLLFFLWHALSTATREQSGNNRLGSCSHQQTVYCKRVAGSKANSQPETESIQINSIPSLLRELGLGTGKTEARSSHSFFPNSLE